MRYSEDASFLKKRSKKLLRIGRALVTHRAPNTNKSLAAISSKTVGFLPYGVAPVTSMP
jgi:hypothetical protein